MKLKNGPDIYLKKRYKGTPKINERRQMLEIKQVEDIPANHKMAFEALYYHFMTTLKRQEYKVQQMMSRYKAEHQKVIELQEKLKNQQEEDELDRFWVDVID